MTSSLERLLAAPSSRRSLLRTSAVLSLGAVVVACGGSDEPSAESASADDGSAPGVAAALDGERVEVWRDPG